MTAASTPPRAHQSEFHDKCRSMLLPWLERSATVGGADDHFP